MITTSAGAMQRLLLDILPRFDLTGEQMGRILGENGGDLKDLGL